MLKEDFLEMQREDLVTKKDETLNALLECFKEVLKDFPVGTDIESNKTVEECYKQMYDYASKHKVGQSFCFTPKETKHFVETYLGVEHKKVGFDFVKLEDFF